ncbi:DNA mismatch repair protein PMS1, partial [Dictyocoela roeselum]
DCIEDNNDCIGDNNNCIEDNNSTINNILTNISAKISDEVDDGSFLIIIDQHAADEIRNFEHLQDEFYLKKQRLIIPKKLDLNVIDEYILKANLGTIRRNGFEVEERVERHYNSSISHMNSHASTNKSCQYNASYFLTAVPIYKNKIFDLSDFLELLDLLRCDKNSFCSKFRDLMATKACRASVMIGDRLSLKDMEGIVARLGMLRIPWCCPHGRPVFRVLCRV